MLTTKQRTELALTGTPITVNTAQHHKIYAEFRHWARNRDFVNEQAAYDEFLASLIDD